MLLFLIQIHQIIVHSEPIIGEGVEARVEIIPGDPIMSAEKVEVVQGLLLQELVREIPMESMFQQIQYQKLLLVMVHRILAVVERVRQMVLEEMEVLVLPLL